MIPRKKKICNECGREDYIFSKGRCKSCAIKSYRKPKKYSKKGLEKKQERSKKLSSFFEYHLQRCAKSEESGIPIKNPTKANVCHLIDKGRFPSVEDHLENYIYLTVQEHTKLDQYLFTNDFEAVKENFKNSWEIICKRLKILLPLVKERHKHINKWKDFLKIK